MEHSYKSTNCLLLVFVNVLVAFATQAQYRQDNQTRALYSHSDSRQLSQETTDDTSVPVPHSWHELLSQMNEGGGPHSVIDFISYLQKDDGQPVEITDVFVSSQSDDGKMVITGGGLMAVSDECSPRNMSVRLPLNYSDSQVAYYPECTMVQRCGGCCPTPYLKCEPLYKENIVLKVLRARYQFPGSFSMRWEGFSSVTVERHLSCRAVCNITSQDCGPMKKFIKYQCKCQCRRFDRCNPDQKWNADRCACECRSVSSCCRSHTDYLTTNEVERSCQLFFNHDSCECSLKSAIGAQPNATQAEIEAWQTSRAIHDDAASAPWLNPQASRLESDASSTTITMTTMTAMTTTTPSTTTQSRPSDPCFNFRCHSSFIPHRSIDGRCLCRLSMRMRGTYASRRHP